MRTLARAVALTIALAAALPVGRPAVAGVFNPQTFSLGNGMRVVVIENHRAPVVTHMVWYRAGGAEDPPGHSGIAHLLEHLMFKGTRQHPGGEFSRIVARNGGRENAFTSYDYTAYYQTIARDRLETVIALEAERMTNLLLGKKQVETELEVVLEERRMRIGNNPAAILNERADAILYLNHPYRRPVIGWKGELESLSAEEVLRFYRGWYAPNNATLVVAGDITAAKVRPLAEKYYGAIAPAALPPRPDLEPPVQRTARRVTLRDAKVRQPMWSRTYSAPSYRAGASEHTYALQLATWILGSGPTSRLYRQLVVDDKLAVAAGTAYTPTARGPARFLVYAAPRPGVTMERIEAEVEKIVDRFVARGVSANELARAKRRMLAEAVYARDSLTAGANILGEALSIGLTVEDVEQWPERIAAVTTEQVAAAARAVLASRNTVTQLLLPAAASAAGDAKRAAAQ